MQIFYFTVIAIKGCDDVIGESVIIELDDSEEDDVAGDIDIKDEEDVDTFINVSVCWLNQECERILSRDILFWCLMARHCEMRSLAP